MKKIFLSLGITVLVVLVIYALLICCFVNLLSDNLSKKQIFSLVNKNYELLNECVDSGDFSDVQKLRGVKKVTVDNDVLDVYCGGSGFGSATNYYGFYYSPSDKPLVVWCGYINHYDVFTTENNGYSIRNSNDDNWYYTEKIRKNFFYYESHF